MTPTLPARVLLTVATAAALISAGLLAAPAAAASTLAVDDDGVQCPGAYTSIGAAVAAASDGETIEVCAGTYAEQVSTTLSLTFRGAAATGEGTSEVTSVDGAFVIGGVGSTSVVEGFTITGATATPSTAGVRLLGGGGHHISNNTIIGNSVAVSIDAQISDSGVDGVLIDANTLEGNTRGVIVAEDGLAVGGRL
jgi:hypothetical protein